MLCLSCKNDLDDEQFSWKDRRVGARQKWCKACSREYARQHYLRNKDEYKARSMRSADARRGVARDYVYRVLRDAFCVDCGEKDPIVLDFDHVDPSKKKDSICNMVRNGLSVKAIADEVAKCDVRCANCHRRRTSEMLGWYKSLRNGV